VSKARLVITAVEIEAITQAEAAARYGVSKGWVSKLVARYRAEGETAFEPRSRRPHTSPTTTARSTVQLIVNLREKLATAGLDAGPDTIAWHLEQHHKIRVSVATISRHLTKAGLIVPEPKKKPKSAYIRFEAVMPNETWQSDFTHYRLNDTGPDTEVLTWLDDHSRFALSITVHPRVTAPIVNTTFLTTAATHGIPGSTLTDNGMVYTTRFAGGRGGKTKLENSLRRLNVVQKNSRPNHPTTCGKVERFQQTMKKWLRAQPTQPTTIVELQALLEKFQDEYNHRRPHRSLPGRMTPATAYQARPKATPRTDRSADTHDRIRTDKIDKAGSVTLRHNGRLHHIGIGRTHAGTHVLLLVEDLQIRIINRITGELLRELTLDPQRDYQPTGAPKGPTRKGETRQT